MGLSTICAGATGLVGQELISQLRHDERVKLITILGRRDLWQSCDDITFKTCDFLSFPQENTTYNIAFCCLGTTIKKSGSRQNFSKVDLDFVINFAKYCREAGVKTFSVVSSVGASKSSPFFYNRVKGQMEESLKSLNFESLMIFRPSLLIGNRQELRAGEFIGQWIYKTIGHGPLKPMLGTPAHSLASHMIEKSITDKAAKLQVIGPKDII